MSEQILYAKASVERKPEYRQQTLILQDGEDLKARKIPIGEAAKEHIRSYKKNYETLTKALKKEASVSFVPCTENGEDSVDFPFCHAATLADKLTDRNLEEYIEIVSQFIDALTESFGTVPYTDNEGFKAFYGDIRMPENLEALTVTNADMNFDNVFCNEDGTYTIIDYEWIFSFSVPLTYLIYRSLLLDPAYRQFIDEEKQKVLDHFGITEALQEQFDQMELAFLRNISPEEYKLDYFARIPEARKTVIHEINALLALEEANNHLTEANQKLSDDLNHELSEAIRLTGKLADAQERNDYYQSRLWFKSFRKVDNGLRKCRGGIRSFARQDNAIGRGCSFLLISAKEGPASAYKKVSEPQRAKKKERIYLKGLDLTDQETNFRDYPTDIKISVLVPLYNTPIEFLREMIESVKAQTYPNWELCLADGSDDKHGEVGEECQRQATEDDRIVYQKLEKNLGISENTNACIDMATGEYYALFDHDDLLQPNALIENIKAICDQGADFIYSDEFVFESPDKSKLIATHFKPDYSPENMLSNNYICHLSVFKATLIEKAGKFRKECDGSQDHDIILRLTDCAEKVVHIPKVLYFWRSHPTSVASDISTKTYAIDAGKKAVADFLHNRKGIDAIVESTPEYPTMYHVRYPIEGEPLVNIVLDCRDPEKAAGQIRKLCEQTEYGNYIFTATSRGEAPEKETDLPVTWIRTDAESRAERLNEAIRKTSGEYIVLLDADLDGLNKDWLTEMLMLCQQKQIGAVGAKILFDDDTLRHGGLIIGLGNKRLIGRSHFGAAADNAGYFGQLAIAGNVSAVSAECMMFRRTLFEEMKGFRIEYQETLYDVDFCLRLAKNGYRNLYTPFAKMRGGDIKNFSLNYGTEYREYVHDAKSFVSMWKELNNKPDPYYNPNLTLDSPDYSIRV